LTILEIKFKKFVHTQALWYTKLAKAILKKGHFVQNKDRIKKKHNKFCTLMSLNIFL